MGKGKPLDGSMGGRPKNQAWKYHGNRVRETRLNSIADFYENLGYLDAGCNLENLACHGYYDWSEDIGERAKMVNGMYYPRYEFVRRFERGEYEIGRFPELDKKYKRGTPDSMVPDKAEPVPLQPSKFEMLMDGRGITSPRVLDVLMDAPSKEALEAKEWLRPRFKSIAKGFFGKSVQVESL